MAEKNGPSFPIARRQPRRRLDPSDEFDSATSSQLAVPRLVQLRRWMRGFVVSFVAFGACGDFSQAAAPRSF